MPAPQCPPSDKAGPAASSHGGSAVNRLSTLAAHPRRTLGALAVVLAAVGITVGSGASFTASAANPGNAFSTGTLVIANSPSTALLSVTGMKPGDTSSST